MSAITDTFFLCEDQFCVATTGACRPNVPTFDCRANMWLTCRRHVANCPTQVRTKSSSGDDDDELSSSFIFISITLPTLTHVAIASMQRTTPTPAATSTIIAASKRPPRDCRTHNLPIIGFQPPLLLLLPHHPAAPPPPGGGHTSQPRLHGSRTTTAASITRQKQRQRGNDDVNPIATSLSWDN
jgi:hypothetical protein